MSDFVNGVPRGSSITAATVPTLRGLDQGGGVGPAMGTGLGISLGGVILQRVLGIGAALFAPVPLANGTLRGPANGLGPSVMNRGPLQPTVPAQMLGQTVHIPKSLERFVPNLRTGDFDLFRLPARLPSLPSIQPWPSVAVGRDTPTRWIPRGSPNVSQPADGQLPGFNSYYPQFIWPQLRRKQLTSMANALNVMLELDVPELPAWIPPHLISGVRPFMAPSPHLFHTWEFQRVFDPISGGYKNELVRVFDQWSYDQAYQAEQSRYLYDLEMMKLSQDNYQHSLEAYEAKAKARQAELDALTETAVGIRQKNSAIEFTHSVARGTYGTNKRHSRQKNDKKKRDKSLYATGLRIINRTYGSEAVELGMAFVDSLYLEVPRSRRKRDIPGYQASWVEADGGYWAYRPRNVRQAYNDYASGKLQLDEERFLKTVVANQIEDAVLGYMNKGVRKLYDGTGYASPIGVQAGWAL